MNKKYYQSFFKDKIITIMGLGVLGRGLQVTQFLAECGAKITVTDLKKKSDLAVSLKKLKKYKIRYVLGKHDMNDFEHIDMVIKAAGVPLNSPYIHHAQSHKIPILMDASLFARVVRSISPRITIIGITGTRGKSMTTALTYHILKTNEKKLGCTIYLGGNMRAKATLPLLQNVTPGDIVVLELDSWQCQGFGDEKISPHISVFTNLMPDHMNYYNGSMKKYLADKSNIFNFQTFKDILIINSNMQQLIPKMYKGILVITKSHSRDKIPQNIIGAHNTQNASYARVVAKQCGLDDILIDKAISTFPGLEGRLQLLQTTGVHVINDNNSTTPEATIAGIEGVRKKYKKSRLILIIGGADKKLDLKNLVKSIAIHCDQIVFLPGSGTDRLKKMLSKKLVTCVDTKTMKDAVEKAYKTAKKDNVILFSPGFASFGLFQNEYDRNDQFIKIITQWK